MPVSGIIPEIMQDEEFEEEKSYDEHNRRHENILTNGDIVDAVKETRYDDTGPKSLDTLHLCVSFPTKCFLTERKASSAVEESEEGESSTSVERHAHHAKECVWEVSEDGSEHGIVDDGFMTLSCSREIEHVFDIFCEGEPESDESDAIHIVCDTFRLHSSAQEEPEDDESDEAETTDDYHECFRVSCSEESIDKSPDDKDIDENNSHPQRFPDTEYEECQLREFFEKCEEENDAVYRPLFWYSERFEGTTEIVDKIISFNIDIKEEERQFATAHVWVLNGPIKRQKDTSDDDNTREEKCKTLSETYLTIPLHKAPIDECADAGDDEWKPKCLKKIEDDREMHNYWTT